MILDNYAGYKIYSKLNEILKICLPPMY